MLESPKIGLKLPEVLTVNEINSILDTIDLTLPEGQRNRAMLEVLYSCGLRVSELVSLRFTDVYFDEGFIKVEGKGSKQRLVPISETAIKEIKNYLYDRNHVDILSDIDLRALYNHHAETNPLATLLVSKRNTSRYLLFNKENKLCGWRNRETGEVKSFYPDFDPNQYNEYAFSGIHVLSPKIFDWMEEWTGKFSIINFYLSICAKTNIHAYADENLHLIDVGKPETLQVAEKWMKTLIV